MITVIYCGAVFLPAVCNFGKFIKFRLSGVKGLRLVLDTGANDDSLISYQYLL